MTNKKNPITFSIDKDTISAIEAYKGRTHSVSTSAIIRAAIERFDFDYLDTPTNETKQVSLRLDSVVRDKLKAVAKSQVVSVGSFCGSALWILSQRINCIHYPAQVIH